jgi:predicted restriction endonuclease
LTAWRIEDTDWWRAYHSPAGKAERQIHERVGVQRTSVNPLRVEFNQDGALRWRVLARDDYTCRTCGATGATAEITVDHIVPISRGGANDEGNLQALCRSCNSRKGAR